MSGHVDITFVRRWLGVIIALTALVPSCWSDSHNPSKLAVVDVGSVVRVPANFMDFVALSLGREPQVALLERGQVEQVLREQSLGIMLAGTNAVRAGKLVSADAFLMLESQSNQAVRVRLVDARYGLKLWDTMFALNANANDSEERAQALAKGTVFRLANFVCGADTPRTVSISAFRSEEISTRWDWLGDALETGIEQQLALQPGIVVVERARTRPLTEERELTSELPESLMASTVIVDGAFHIDRAEGTNSIMVALRCRRDNMTRLVTTLAGSVTNLAGLQQTIVSIVASNVGTKADCGSMDPAAEAGMLAAEASSLLGEDPKHALHLAEAAAALVPGERKYENLLIEVYSRWLGSTPDECLTYGLRGLVLMEQLVRRDGKCPRGLFNFLGCLFGKLNWPFPGNHRAEMALPEYRERFRELCDTFWRVTEECRLAAKGKDQDALHWLLQRTSDAYRLSPSTMHAIEQSRRTQEEFVELFKVHNSGPLESSLIPLVSAYFDPSPATWPLEKDAGHRITDYLGELSNSDDVLVRMLAERALIAFYGANEYGNTGKPVDYVNARKHAENYVSAVSAARQTYPRLYEFYVGTLKNTKFSDNPQENESFQQRMLAILDLPSPPTVASTNVGEFAPERVVSLESALKEFSSTGWQNPERGNTHFRRIVVGTNLAAIVYTHGMLFREHCGVLRLDVRTLRPYSSVSSSVEVPFQTHSGNLQTDYARFGPSVAECDGDIFVGFPMGGIIRFRKDGTSVALNEADGLATDNVMGLDVLDGKLYALVGEMFGESGVMEVDLQSGVSKILFSTKSKFHRNELDARTINGIAADRNHHILWVLTPEGFFSYGPSDQSIKNRTDLAADILKTFQSPVFLSLQRQAASLFVGGIRACLRINMETEQVEVLAASMYYPFGNTRSRWRISNETPRRIVEVPDGLVFMDEGNGTGRSAQLCLNGRSKPVDILNACFPSEIAAKLTVRDLASINDGLLLLTDDALWMIPGLRSEKQDP